MTALENSPRLEGLGKVLKLEKSYSSNPKSEILNWTDLRRSWIFGQFNLPFRISDLSCRILPISKFWGILSLTNTCKSGELLLLIILFGAFAITAHAQVRGQTPATARAAAPVDFTGYWVSVVTEDWRCRMVTPARGDFASIPLNAEGRKVGEAWDPAKDEAAGEQCRAYGSAGI